MLLVAEAALSEMPDDVTAVGGLTMGADAMAFSLAGIAAVRGRELRAFSVRKEVKDHGGGGRLAGALEAHGLLRRSNPEARVTTSVRRSIPPVQPNARRAGRRASWNSLMAMPLGKFTKRFAEFLTRSAAVGRRSRLSLRHDPLFTS